MTYSSADFVDLRGLSLRQPYADLVALGAKRVETRGRDIGAQPGQVVAIHASLKCFAHDAAPAAWRIRTALAVDENTKYMRHGDIVAVARVAAVHWTSTLFRAGLMHPCYPMRRGDADALDRACDGRWMEEIAVGDWSEGRSLIVLRDVVRLREPVPCRGMLGLWRVPGDVRDAVLTETARA